MANLINANSNQNYFHFHGSHYRYEEGAPLGLPISSSIFKNFLQNLEGKFIKSSSKGKVLNSLTCTPGLFIYFILPTLYGSGRSLWGPLIVLTERYVSSHPLWPLPWNLWCSRDAGISNDDSRHKDGAQAVIRCAQVGTTWPPWQWWMGCCTTPTNTLTCWFTEKFTHSLGEICWSTILLKWHLLYNPIIAWVWYNIIPHWIHVTPLTVPSKKYGPMT